MAHQLCDECHVTVRRHVPRVVRNVRESGGGKERRRIPQRNTAEDGSGTRGTGSVKTNNRTTHQGGQKPGVKARGTGSVKTSNLTPQQVVEAAVKSEEGEETANDKTGLEKSAKSRPKCVESTKTKHTNNK